MVDVGSVGHLRQGTPVGFEVARKILADYPDSELAARANRYLETHRD
jgi:hypothetical protein